GAAHPPQHIEAYALARSYSAGHIARIELVGRTSGARVRVFHAGLEHSNAMPAEELLGAPVAARVTISKHEARIRVGGWESGLYFARIDAPAGHAYAPFVVRPQRLGRHRIAVVLPTNTWQAYNFRDANHDGIGDTWYADPRLTVELDRPFQKQGMPPHYPAYDLLF